MENLAEEQQNLQAQEPKAESNGKKHRRRRRHRSRSGQSQSGGRAPEARRWPAAKPNPQNAGSRG